MEFPSWPFLNVTLSLPSAAFTQMGYRFSPTFVQNLLAKYDPRTRKLTLDNFIVACVQIKRLTGKQTNQSTFRAFYKLRIHIVHRALALHYSYQIRDSNVTIERNSDDGPMYGNSFLLGSHFSKTKLPNYSYYEVCND